MKKKYAQVMACVLSLALLISGCAGSGSAESTGNTNGTDNALAFVNPTDSTDNSLATDPTGTAATDPTGTGATEATGETADPTETSGAATEATSPATSGSSSGSSSSGSSGSSSGGTSSGSTGTGNSSSGSSNSGSSSSGSGSSSGGSSSGSGSSSGPGSGSSSGSGSETTPPTTEATEPTTEPVVVHTHSYKKTVVSPTCTASGYTVYTCSCGDSYTSDYVDALGHDWECTGAVNEGYWLHQLICGCGEVFDTLEEWEEHSTEVYASGDVYTYYANCCHWASHDNWVVTRAGWEHTCTRCGEYWFEEATPNPYA